MKVAILLNGYFNSRTDLSSKGEDGFKYIKKHILDKCNTDVFIHSWEPTLNNYLNNLYQPKKIICEPQVNFSPILNEKNVDKEIINYWRSIRRPVEDRFSFMYSQSKVFNLLRDYEIENNFNYDIVIKGRFDLGRINRNSSGPGKNYPYAVQCINFNTNLDMNKIYVADWSAFDEGICDIWWYSNSDNMRKFADLYDSCFDDYWNVGSDYYQSLKNKNNLFNAIWLIKQFMVDNNLWEKVQPLETTWE